MTLATLDAYFSLLAQTRCKGQENPNNLVQFQFHLFPSMVISRLENLVSKKEYDFIHFSSYLDKHYSSVKRCASQSLFCFLLPSFAFVIAETNEKEGKCLYVYDCVADRALDIHIP